LTGSGHDRAVSGRPAGRVGRAHGLDGSFYVTGANPRLLELGAKLTVEGVGVEGAGVEGSETVEIVRRAGTDQRPIVRLAGVVSREAAEALRGRPLTVADADLPELDDGEYWAHELEGCKVLDGDRQVGVVVRLLELPSCEVLEVALGEAGSGPLLVPMVKDAIRSIDVGAGKIDVDIDFVEGG
jgi:16S rRNA processing protein RimM